MLAKGIQSTNPSDPFPGGLGFARSSTELHNLASGRLTRVDGSLKGDRCRDTESPFACGRSGID